MGAGGVPRVRFEGVDYEELVNQRFRARVDMAWRGESYVGLAEREAGGLGPLQCAAEATCDALQRIISGVASFEVLDIETVKVMDTEAVVVALAVHPATDAVKYSVGFCLIKGDDGPGAAVKSVLNGTNRILARLLPGD